MHNAIKAAQRFIVDDDLEAWVAHQNVSKGINPAPALTLQEARVVKERMGVEAPRTHRGARQWLQRWRRRRELRLRKFPVLEPLDERDMHGKASSQTDAKSGPTFSPRTNSGCRVKKKTRPIIGFCFEAACTTPITDRAQKTAAVFSNRFVFFASVCSFVRRRGCGAGVISCRAWIPQSESEFLLTWTRPVCDWCQRKGVGMLVRELTASLCQEFPWAEGRHWQRVDPQSRMWLQSATRKHFSGCCLRSSSLGRTKSPKKDSLR